MTTRMTDFFGYTVIVDYNSDLIELTSEFHDGRKIHKLATEVIRLQEQTVRDALIAMGWTPPAAKPHR